MMISTVVDVKVAPAELESLLLTHPNVNDAAVVGVPDETAGEVPKAFVVPKPGTNPTENDVKTFISGNKISL